MGKSVKKVLGVVLPIAMVAASVFLPPLAALAVSAGLAIASSVLIGPKIPKTANLSQTTDRLASTFDLTAPRKLVLGNTAMRTDIRW